MSLGNKTKINQLLKDWPKGAVYLSSWLARHGYSSQLLNRYKKSNWITSIGSGALIRYEDSVQIEGAIWGIQKQGNGTVHPGGKTALGLLGKSHYLTLSVQQYVLFGKDKEKIPGWLQNHHWPLKLNYYSTSFLPPELGLIDHEINGFTIKISSAARAIMECLYLSPDKQDIKECYQLMEGLNNLRPVLVQELLMECSSVKVKRLFLYLATKAGHSWLNFLNLDTIDLGSGKRQLTKDGVYVPEFKITVPKEIFHGEL